MVADERMQCFIRSLDRGSTPFLEKLFSEASADGVPVIRTDTRIFIRTLLCLAKPVRVLEVGTGSGCSALLFCEYGPPAMHVTTIENYAPRIRAARENFKRAGKEEQITLLCGDAGSILGDLTETFDMIFMDAAKGQYINWLPDVLRLLSPGGMLLSDNVLQEGDIVESHFLVERRSRTIYKRMREYLYQITHNPALTTSVLPVGDGLAVSVKTEEWEYQHES